MGTSVAEFYESHFAVNFLRFYDYGLLGSEGMHDVGKIPFLL
jgi:hypothetical protein